MATPFAQNIGDVGGGGGGAGTVGNTEYRQISPMTDPTFANLFNQTQGAIPGAVPGLDSLIQAGMNSPLLQLILGPALERLKAPQAQQREQFTESARSAGGLRGSAYTGGMNKLMQNQGQAQNDLMSQVIQQVLSTLVQGQLQSQQNQFLPARSMTDLLRSITPQTVRGSAGGGGGGAWDNIPPSQGLATPMYGDYKPGNAITQPGVGAPYNTGGSTGAGSNNWFTPTPAPPPAQYSDPWANLGGGAGGGWYDIGQGQQWLGGLDDYGYTQNDWAVDPYYNDF